MLYRARRKHCGSLCEVFSHFSNKWLFSKLSFPISCTSTLCVFNLVHICSACLCMSCGSASKNYISHIPYICFAVKEGNEFKLIGLVSDLSLCKFPYVLTISGCLQMDCLMLCSSILETILALTFLKLCRSSFRPLLDMTSCLPFCRFFFCFLFCVCVNFLIMLIVSLRNSFG